MDQNLTGMKLSYNPTSRDAVRLVYLREDDCVRTFLMDRDEKSRLATLQV